MRLPACWERTLQRGPEAPFLRSLLLPPLRDLQKEGLELPGKFAICPPEGP